MHRDLKP
jgi:calcium/calmodulin-dependent protein kinase I